MDNQKDFFIKEKLQKDRIISQKADDVFNNFFKGDLNMNQHDEMKNENSNESKEKTKVKSNKKYKKLVATAASVLVLFGAANVYAMTQGYENIFFMIKYLTTGEQTIITDKNEILSDRDMTISYEPIKITNNIRLQVKNLQIKDNEAKLFLVVNEDKPDDGSIVPLNYKVYNSNGTLLCSQGSSKELDNTEWNTMYTEELKLSDFKESDNILNLEIYRTDSKLITKVKINLKDRTLEVEGEEDALEKVSEIELKEFLGYTTLMYNIEDGELVSDENKIWAAIITGNYMDRKFESVKMDSLKDEYKYPPYGFKADDINLLLESVYNVRVEDLKPTENSEMFMHEVDGEKYFVTNHVGSLWAPSECIDITSISYCGGLYTATYTFCTLDEYTSIFDIDINDYDIYENTVTFEMNEDEEKKEISKFRLISSGVPVVIKPAEEKEEGVFEGEVVIPANPDTDEGTVDDLPVNEESTNSSDKEIVEEYFAGIWYGYFSGNVLTIKNDMTFTVKFNDEIIDSGTIELKEYSNSEIPHIIFKYDNGNIYDYERIVTGEVSLQSSDADEVYEGRRKEDEVIDNNTDEDLTDNTEENKQNETKVDNYASTMSWSEYYAPGIKIKYPTIFNVEEVGGYNRGNNQGEISTIITGVATGVNPDTKEIINSNMTIEIYEPLYKSISTEEIETLDRMCKYTRADGTIWYEDYNPDENGGATYVHTSYEIDPNNPEYSGWEYRVVFSVDVDANYKVINIINWFLKSTQFISY